MSMLAEKRTKNRWILNPRSNQWSEDSSKFGQKLLEKMGWKPGNGLGINQQGETSHVKVNVRSDNRGVGFKDRPEDILPHQENFSNLLEQLATTVEDQPVIATESSSLEMKSQQSRTRVHYHRSTRGKDLSRYSEKDLACILGISTVKTGSSRDQKVEQWPVVEPTFVQEEVEASPDDEDSLLESPLKKKNKKKRRAVEESPCNGIDIDEQPEEMEQEKDSVDCKKSKKRKMEETEAVEELEEVTEKKQKKKKSKQNRDICAETSVVEEIDVESSIKSQINEEEDLTVKKKKKKRKQAEEVTETDMTDDLGVQVESVEADIHDGSEKRKKKKKKHVVIVEEGAKEENETNDGSLKKKRKKRSSVDTNEEDVPPVKQTKAGDEVKTESGSVTKRRKSVTFSEELFEVVIIPPREEEEEEEEEEEVGDDEVVVLDGVRYVNGIREDAKPNGPQVILPRVPKKSDRTQYQLEDIYLGFPGSNDAQLGYAGLKSVNFVQI